MWYNLIVQCTIPACRAEEVSRRSVSEYLTLLGESVSCQYKIMTLEPKSLHTVPEQEWVAMLMYSIAPN